METKHYSECDWCDTEIHFGNAAVVVTRNIEQIDKRAEQPDAVVTVIQSDTLLTLCADCGNQLDSEAVEEVLRAPIRRTR